MLVLTAHDVGPVAYARLVRDRAVQPLTTLMALPADVGINATLKAQSLSWAVPKRGVISGLAALWIHGCVPGTAPRHIEIAVPRGAHPDPPSDEFGYVWAAVTEPVAVLASSAWGGIGVTSPAAASVAALRRDDHTDAIPAVCAAISRRLCTVSEIETVVGSHSRRGRGYDRMYSAWRELRALATAAPDCASR